MESYDFVIIFRPKETVNPPNPPITPPISPVTKHKLKEKWVWFIAIAALSLSYTLNAYSQNLFNGYNFGYEILIVNGLLTFIGLYLIRRKSESN